MWIECSAIYTYTYTYTYTFTFTFTYNMHLYNDKVCLLSFGKLHV